MRNYPNLLRIGSASLLGLLAGCSVKPPGADLEGRITNYVNCQLPKDQGRGSLLSPWGSISVPILFDRDFYLADEGEILPSLRASIDTWNRWAAFKSKTAFSIKNDGSGHNAGSQIPSLPSSCSQAAYSASVTDAVGVWKITGEGDAANSREACDPVKDSNNNVIAYGKILPIGVQGQTDWVVTSGRITGASILLNFEEFNSAGRQRLDVESLLLHELGHVLGLLHSCNGGGGDQTSSPTCGSGSPAKYLNAVMYPFLEGGQERRNLTANDYDRINCLY